MLAYWTLAGVDANPDLPRIVAGVIEIACNSLPSEPAGLLISDVLETLNEVMMHERCLSVTLLPLLPSILRSLRGLDPSPSSQSVLQSTLQFFVLTAHVHRFTAVDRNAIETSTRAVHGDDPPTRVFDRMAQILSGECLISLKPSFIVRHPKILRTMAKAFARSERLPAILGFIRDLCHFAPYNGWQAHRSGIDLWLLDRIKSVRGDPNVATMVEEALALFVQISSIWSSVTVIDRFFSLFSPIADGVLSDYHPLFLKTLEKMLTNAKQEPKAMMALTSGNSLVVEDFPPALVTEDFVMVFWVWHSVETPRYTPDLFCISHSPERFLRLCLHGEYMNIFENTDEYETIAQLHVRVPTKQWTLISILFEYTSPKFRVFARAGHDDPDGAYLPMMTWPVDGKLTFTVGGMDPRTAPPEFPSYITAFGLFSDFSEETAQSFFECGPVSAPPLPPSCKFFYQIEETESGYAFASATHPEIVKLNSNTPRLFVSHPFSDVLIRSAKIDLMLPLFPTLAMITRRGQLIPNLLDHILSIFVNLFALSREAQRSFMELNGFGIMGHLLLKLPRAFLNYSLYLRLFALLHALSNSDLQREFIDTILMNWELWRHCVPDDHEKIIRHWSRSLYPSFAPQVEAIRSFGDILLSVLRRDPVLKSPEFRRNWMSICTSMRPTAEDLAAFIVDFGTVSNDLLVHGLLQCFSNMVTEHPAMFTKVGDRMVAVSYLITCFAKAPADLSIFFRLIVRLHADSLVPNCSLGEHLDVILYQMKPEYITTELFHCLADFVFSREIMAFLPFCAWMSVNVDENDQAWFVQRLKPYDSAHVSDTASLWLVVLLFDLVQIPLQRLLLSILAFSNGDDWSRIYVLIEMIYMTLNMNVDHAQSLQLQYLVILSDAVGGGAMTPTQEQMSVLSDMQKDFIFRSQGTSCSLAFGRPRTRSRSGSHNSETGIPLTRLRKRSFAKHEFLHPFQLLHRIVGVKYTVRPIRMSLRMTPAGLWRDSDFAFGCFSLFVKDPFRTDLPFALMLAYFLTRTHPSEIVTGIANLNLTTQEVSENAAILSLISHKIPALQFGHLPTVETFSTLSVYAAAILPLNRVWQVLLRALTSARERCEQLVAFVNDTVSTAALNRGKQRLAQLDARMRETGVSWRRLWRCMTVERAPWAVEGEIKECETLKRDPILCNGLFPARVRAVAAKNSPAGISSQSSSPILSFRSGQSQLFRLPSYSPDVFSDFAIDVVAQAGVSHGLLSIRKDLIRVRKDSGASRDFAFADISRVLHRTRFGRPTAMEIFVRGGRTMLVDFDGQNSFDILNRLAKLLPESAVVQTTPFTEFFASFSFTQDWLKGRLSNFTYISLLNMLGGRSFDDVTQYPLFPWVLADLESEELSLSNPSTYRDFAEPFVSDVPMCSEIVQASLGRLNPFSRYSEERIGSVASFISDLAKNGFELVPEFYFLAEILDETAELPTWAGNSPLTFVYMHRKALESPVVTERLHSWIDRTWGCYTPDQPDAVSEVVNGCPPHRLFSSPHPHRVWHSWRRAPLDRVIVCQLPAPVLWATVRSREVFVYELTCIESRGDIVQLRVNMVNAENQKTVTPKCGGFDFPDDGLTFRNRISIPRFGDFSPTLAPNSVRLFGNTVAMIPEHSTSVALIDIVTGSRSELRFHKGDVVCLDEHGGWFVTAGRDAVVNVYAIDSLVGPRFSIPLYRDGITCCSVNAGFGLIASGTRDGFLVLSSLDKGSNIQVIDLGGRRPYAVLITKAWGFVVVCETRLDNGILEYSISVYSPNGAFARRQTMQDSVSAWTSFSSGPGFDYLVVATEQGKLLYCEVFFLDFAPVKVARLASPIVGVSYPAAGLGLLLVCANAEMVLIPLVVDS
jgi:hypothetical protein